MQGPEWSLVVVAPSARVRAPGAFRRPPPRSARSSSQSIRSSAKARLSGVAPELSDPVGSLEVGEHEDVEQLGARSRPEGLKALREATLKVIRSIGKSLRRREASPGPMYGSSDGCDG